MRLHSIRADTRPSIEEQQRRLGIVPARGHQHVWILRGGIHPGRGSRRGVERPAVTYVCMCGQRRVEQLPSWYWIGN